MMFNSLGQYINMAWVYYGFAAAYAITVISIIAVILSENRNPLKSLAWVTVLMLLPGAGIVLYLFFGRSIKNTRMISRRNRRRLRKRERVRNVDLKSLGLSAEAIQQIKLGHSLTGAQFYTGNDVEIFDNGSDKFDRLLADIAGATRYINMQYYIFEDDNVGQRVREALMERARAGVKVRVIYDHVGSLKVRNRFFGKMRAAGIEVYPFFKVSFPQLGTHINWRNHRKLCVIDGRLGYIGGMNVADRYVDGGRFALWRDLHLRIDGPAVAALQYSFAVDWNFMGQPLIEEPVLSLTASPGNVAMQMIASGPTSQWANIALSFQKAIANAKRRVYIQTPYFLPTEALLKALEAAALAHVDVRVMMPRRSDSIMLTHASGSYIAECLRAGIKIYFYDAGMLHSKAVLVDNAFCTIGSSNFDFRSFEHNFEANMFIYSAEMNARLSEIMERDMEQSHRITPAGWRRRPIAQKIAQSVLRLLSPIL